MLKNYGLHETDPRLLPMMNEIRKIEQEKEEMFHEAKDPKHRKLNKKDFTRYVKYLYI